MNRRSWALLLFGAWQARGQTEAARLEAEAVAAVRAGDGRAMAALTERLKDRDFLRRLDPPEGAVTPVVRLGRVFEAMRLRPTAGTEALCVALARNAEFRSVAARMNGLLGALAARRPMTEAGAAVMAEAARAGFWEPVGIALGENGSARAMAVLEALLTDEASPAAGRVQLAHRVIPARRVHVEMLRLCVRVAGRAELSAAVAAGVGESVFLYEPREWFGASAPAVAPPDLATARGEAREALRALGNVIRQRPGMPVALLKAIR